MPRVPVKVIRWVSDEPQPGWVEARLTDARGHEWAFFDKSPIFVHEAISPTTALPVDGTLECEVLARDGEIATIRTRWAEADDGTSEFDVLAGDIR